MIDPDELERLKLAWSIHVTTAIADADGVLDFAEIELLGALFPDALLRDRGFLDAEAKFTPAYEDARDLAIGVLGAELAIEEKLEMVTFFHQACGADGEIDPREVDVVYRAAATLNIPGDVLRRHWSSLTRS